MSKYINANELKLILNREHLNYSQMIEKKFVLNAIDEMPSADVRENIHGEWENKLPDGWQCSECFEIIPLRFMAMFCWGRNRMNFCPNCGADMRGDKDTNVLNNGERNMAE